MTSHANGDTQTPPVDLEKRLRETVQRYQMVFKATNEVLYELNLETGVVLWNDGLTTQYGYDQSEDAGTMEWWAAHIHPDDALRVEHEISQWLESGNETWQAEYRFQKADGSYIDVRDRGVVRRSPDGRPLQVIGSFLDITRQKQLDRAKDEFISLVSHQLRTPLTAIRLYSDMLSSGMYGELTNKQQDPVERINEAAIRLIDLVGNILDISKLESGHLVSNPVPTMINELIQECVREVVPIANIKDVDITFHPDENIEKVSVDAVIFSQVVHNLLTNAIRYSKPEIGHVQVDFIKNDDHYLLTVQDNGIGIPKDAQQNIFHRFYRAQNASNIEEHGTGLGLYMIKLMIESAGCDVWFESDEKFGTKFYVKLPLTGMRAG